MKITFINKKTGKMTEEVILRDAEVKALNWDVELAGYKDPRTGKITKGIAGWILNLVGQKVLQCMDAIILEHSDKQPAKLSVEDREAIVNTAPVKSAGERQAEFEAEMDSRRSVK